VGGGPLLCLSFAVIGAGLGLHRVRGSTRFFSISRWCSCTGRAGLFVLVGQINSRYHFLSVSPILVFVASLYRLRAMVATQSKEQRRTYYLFTTGGGNRLAAIPGRGSARNN